MTENQVLRRVASGLASGLAAVMVATAPLADEHAKKKKEVEEATEEPETNEIAEGEERMEPCVDGDPRPVCKPDSAASQGISERGNYQGPSWKLIRNIAYSGGCLRPRNGSKSPGAPVVLSSCANTTSRIWKPIQTAAATGGEFYYRIKNLNSLLCLARTDDRRLVQQTCETPGKYNEGWSFENTVNWYLGDGGEFQLKGDRFCLGATSPSSVRMRECQNTSSRRWKWKTRR